MSARCKAPALAAACDALRAVQLPDEADALAAARTNLYAVQTAACAALAALAELNAAAERAMLALHDEWLSAVQAARADGSWWGDARAVLYAEQKAQSARCRVLADRWDAAASAVRDAEEAIDSARKVRSFSTTDPALAAPERTLP